MAILNGKRLGPYEILSHGLVKRIAFLAWGSPFLGRATTFRQG
jgi:hypothetical protein